MKRLLLTFSLILSIASLVYGQNVDISGAYGNTNATSCTPSSVTVGGMLMCMNYTYNNSTFSVSNDTVYVNVYYSVGLICLGAIVPFTQTINVGNLPANTYHIYARSYLNNTLQDIYSLSTMTVTSCCSAVPQITLSSNPVCVGDTLVMQNTGTGQTSQEWYIDGFLFSNNNTASQPTYSVGSMTIKLVVENSSCADSITQVVNINPLPVVNLGNDTTICSGATLNKSLPNTFANYNWSNGSTTNAGSISAVGSLSVTVTDNFGCINSDTIQVLSIIPLAQVDAGLDVQVCGGDTASITAISPQPNSTFTWSNGTTGNTLNTSISGTYYVTVAANGYCSAKDTVVVSAFATLPINFLANADSCAPRGISINDDYSSYTWSTGEQTDSVSMTQSDTLSITVTDNNGCIQDASMYFEVYNSPNVFIGNDTLICEETSLVLSANIQGIYNWSTGQTLPAISVINPGLYWLEITDQNGCVGADSMMLSVKVCVGIEEMIEGQDVFIYPNPSSDFIIVSTKKNAILAVYNQLGEIVETIITMQGDNRIEVANWSAGIYYLKGSNTEWIKLVKI